MDPRPISWPTKPTWIIYARWELKIVFLCVIGNGTSVLACLVSISEGKSVSSIVYFSFSFSLPSFALVLDSRRPSPNGSETRKLHLIDSETDGSREWKFSIRGANEMHKVIVWWSVCAGWWEKIFHSAFVSPSSFPSNIWRCNGGWNWKRAFTHHHQHLICEWSL